MLKETNTPTRPRIEPGSPDPESDALTIRPVRPHLTVVSGVGSSPALATCETSQNLLAGVSGEGEGGSRGTPVSPHLSIGSSL